MNIKSFNTFVLSSIAAFSLFSSAKESVVDEARYWANSGLSLKHFTDLINNTSCYATDKQFIGCVFALNELASANFSGAVWVPLTYAKQAVEHYGEVVKSDFAPFVLVTAKPLAKDLGNKAAWQNERATKLAYEKALLEAKVQPQKIDFDKISDALIREIKDFGLYNYYLGTAMNEFLHYAYDPHSAFYPEPFFREYIMGGKLNNVYGIGAEVDKVEKGIIIVDVPPGSPAEKAGIVNGDIITKIEGTEISKMKLDQAIELIRGPNDSKVTITVLKESGKTKTTTVTRGPIQASNIRSKMVDHLGQPFAYVRIRRFLSDKPKTMFAVDNTPVCKEFIEALNSLVDKKPKGLIIDVRGNGGGDLVEVTCITSLFVGSAVVAYTLPMDSMKIQETYRWMTGQVPKVPLTVLIDGRSASASEILSGALQDYQRAWLVGERTFGKATVQLVLNSSAIRPNTGNPIAEEMHKMINLTPGFLVKKTVQRYYLPSMESPQIFGVLPDIEVPFKPNATEDERFIRREAELFETATREVGRPRKQKTPHEVAKINECLSSNRAQVAYEQSKNSGSVADYQLLKAEEVMICADKLKLSRSSITPL